MLPTPWYDYPEADLPPGVAKMRERIVGSTADATAIEREVLMQAQVQPMMLAIDPLGNLVMVPVLDNPPGDGPHA